MVSGLCIIFPACPRRALRRAVFLDRGHSPYSSPGVLDAHNLRHNDVNLSLFDALPAVWSSQLFSSAPIIHTYRHPGLSSAIRRQVVVFRAEIRCCLLARIWNWVQSVVSVCTSCVRNNLLATANQNVLYRLCRFRLLVELSAEKYQKWPYSIASFPYW